MMKKEHKRADVKRAVGFSLILLRTVRNVDCRRQTMLARLIPRRESTPLSEVGNANLIHGR